MNILIVTAHPSPKGRTHIIANTYAEEKIKQGHRVQILNLYDLENQIDLLTFKNIKKLKLSKLHLKFQDQITWAKEIVIVHPIWWGLPPAIMKNWVDLTFWAKFAYQYNENGNAQPLLMGKRAKIFATCGGSAWYYYLPFLPFVSFWKTCVFNFSGIEVTDIKICGKLDKLKGDACEKCFQKYLKKVQKSASN